MKFTVKDLKRLFFVILSAFLYSVAMQVFVNSGDLYPGGFAGLALLITRSASRFFALEIPFGAVYIALNILPTILVFKYVGKKFTLYSMIQYGLVSLFTTVLPEVTITEDPLLISVFGGILAGFAISLALNSGASSGGVDFFAVYFSNRFNRPSWGLALGFTTVVLLISGALFGWTIALYSIIFQYCNTQVVSLRHTRYKLVSLMVVTRKPEEVTSSILQTVRHGITVLNGKGGYARQDETVLLMTINAFQVDELVQAAKKADPHVFISISHTERIVGNYYQAPLD
ncbi:MAG: YitT family protein [Erysipelotrichales bacterium]|nr:YitT family protein [Erysipelotrichales bacterium]